MGNRLFATARQCAALVLVVGSLTAQAAVLPLEGRDIDGNPVAANDASAVFEYDPNLDLTWLRDWDVNGLHDWYTQVAWAAGLTYFGGGWRLPFITDTGASGCDLSLAGGTDCGFNVQTKDPVTGTVYSEMAYMWYVELGNLAYYDTSGKGAQPGWGLAHTGPFQNMQFYYYWFGTEYAPDTLGAWGFETYNGYQGNGVGPKSHELDAVAVRPGDVAAVPEPATLALLTLGLAGLGFSRRKQ